MATSYTGIGSGLLGTYANNVQLVPVNTATDPNVSRNDWLLSFVPGIDRWVSYHSYSPLIMENSRTKLVSSAGEGTYEHNAGLPGRYYSGVQGGYVDAHFAPKNDTTVTFQSISWHTEANKLGVDKRNFTFTKATAFNSYQLGVPVTLANLLTVRRAEGEWRFNSFRDVAQPGVTLKVGRNFNPLAVDTNRVWQQQRRFVDRWFSVRLEVDNTDGNMLYLHDVSAVYRTSIR